MLRIVEDFIEVLYMYKTSKLYYFHIGAMAFLLALIIYMLIKEHEIRARESNPPQFKYSTKMDYVGYNKYVKENTAK
jgi:hypothetical protein